MAKLDVHSVNISEKKGTIKQPVDKIILNRNGILGDAHAGLWNRQVSLLGIESIERFENENNRKVTEGEFAENLTVGGVELKEMNPLDTLFNENVVLEITQIGKKCHGTNCSIFQEVGNCVMPTDGIFCRVLEGGVIQPGDVLYYVPKEFKVLIITLSDRASRGDYEDKSGPVLKNRVGKLLLDKNRAYDIQNVLIPDSPELLERHLLKAKEFHVDLVITTGGTGIGPRDITPDVVRGFIDKEIPGIMERIRMKYAEEKPAVLLSRSVAGIMGKTLVFTLPGSVRAVNEYMDVIDEVLLHCTHMIHGLDIH
jgi:molybdopterin adenylyltransferase